MRIARFGIVVLGFALGFSTLLAWRILHPPVVSIQRREPRPADLKSVKADLCRLGHSERKYYRATGHYADQFELPRDGDFAGARERWPYVYHISVPAPDRFIVEAIPFRSVSRRVTVLTMDHSMKVCYLSPSVPEGGWNAGSGAQETDDAEADINCEPCPTAR